ncbi:MAG: DUF4349 domain-containing protein [Patescibacteria group bacterium]
MPPSPSAKRPGILAWIGYGLVVIFALLFIKSVFGRITGHTSYSVTGMAPATQSTMPSGMGGASMGYAENSLVARDMMYEEGEMKGMPIVPPMDPGGSAAVDLDGNAITPKVIKTGSLTLRVDDAAKAMDQVQQTVTNAQGFVESSSISDAGTGPRSAYLTVRIPVAQFEAVKAQLKGLATVVLNESTSGQDVTSQFVDLEADLRNAKAEEASYLEILKKSGTIEDTLEVTKQLAQVRGRIERLTGQERYLSNRTDLATLTITLTEESRIDIPTRTWEPGEVLRNALHDLVVSLQSLVDFLIRAFIAIVGLLLPILLITGLIIWLGWKVVMIFVRRIKR